jgi:hypothetical protein
MSFGTGSTIVLRCDSRVRFYSGLFDQDEYAAARRKSATIFPFERGTDTTSHEEVREPRSPAVYRVVLRIGVLAPKGVITASVWKAARTAVPQSSASLREDLGTTETATKRAWIYFGFLVAVVTVIGLWLLWYDFVVITLSNRPVFFNALNAEGTAVFAVVAVAGGLYGVWRALGFPRRKPGPPNP